MNARICLAALLVLVGPGTAAAQGIVKCLDGKTVTYSNTPCEKLGLKPAGEVKDRVTTLPMSSPAAAKALTAPAKNQPGVAPGNEIDMPKTSTLKPVNPLIEKLAR